MRFNISLIVCFLGISFFSEIETKVKFNFGFISFENEDIEHIGHTLGFQDPWLAYGSGLSILALSLYATQDFWLTPVVNSIDFIKKQSQAQAAQFSKKEDSTFLELSKSKAKIYKSGDIKITLDDVAGMQAAKLDVFDIIQFLKDPQAYIAMGAKIPKGVLLQGPPGTGKTLLAKAIAGQASCPFIYLCAAEIEEMLVGVGSARLRDVFAKAKELAPCIIFFDEFDTVGKKRSDGLGAKSDDHTQTLTQLLTLMDGFDTHVNPIVVLAATNRAEVLDPALLRPGRFDRIVQVDLPLIKDRIDILTIHFAHVKKADNIDIPLIARVTRGFSGADLAHLVNEAAILAVNEGADCVTMLHVDQAYDNITLGRQIQGMEVFDEDVWETAYHEAGHSIIRVFLPDAAPLYKVTIAPRGKALGLSYSLPLREKSSVNEVEMRSQIIVALAGGLAEEAFGYHPSGGKSSDLEMARQIAYNMVTWYGMSEELRYMSYKDIDFRLSDDVATKIHEEVKKIIDECYAIAKTMVADHRHEIQELASMLVEQGTIFGNVVYDLCGVVEPKIEFGLAK